MKKYSIFIFGSLFILPLETFAHGAHGTGFVAGLTHPIFGLDHLVAIIGLSLLSFKLLEKKQWLPSLVFITTMVIGGLLGVRAEEISITEFVIVGSVLAFGLVIAFDLKLSIFIVAGIAALFGFFHGHAHGTEMPEASNIPLYVLGFVLGASLLSAIGFGLSKILTKSIQAKLVGAFIAGMGLMMFID